MSIGDAIFGALQTASAHGLALAQSPHVRYQPIQSSYGQSFQEPSMFGGAFFVMLLVCGVVTVGMFFLDFQIRRSSTRDGVKDANDAIAAENVARKDPQPADRPATIMLPDGSFEKV